MTKKKKKKSSIVSVSPSNSSCSGSNVKAATVVSDSDPVVVVERLLLRCSNNESKTPTTKSSSSGNWSTMSQRRNPHFFPLTVISDSDAQRLDLKSGELVFLLPCRHDEDRRREQDSDRYEMSLVGNVGLCHVNVSKGNVPTGVTSPTSPSKKASNVLSGTVHIHPSSFRTFLFPETHTITTPTKNVDETTLLTPTNNKYNSDSPFSFRDWNTSPHSSSKPNSSNSLTQRLWIVPFRSMLGHKLSQATSIGMASLLRCRLPQSITQVSSSNINPITNNSRNILEKLVQALHLGRFVQVGETLLTLFQGRTIELSICHGSTKEDSTILTSHCENIVLDTIEDNMISTIRAQNIQFFQIHQYTKVEFVDENESLQLEREQQHQQQQEEEEHFVAGLSSVLQHIREFLFIPLLRPELLSQHQGWKIPPPRGILLHGPSGVGKTCLAKQIARELRNSNTPCVVEFVNCASLQSQTSIVGQAERALAALFQNFSRTPKLLILDDIHLICSKRGQQHTDQLASTLLAMMDGAQNHKREPIYPVAILAITNDASALDPALRRPGRLDYEVEVPLPEEPSQRAEILQFHWNKIMGEAEFSNSEWIDLAKDAKGFNGADCLLAIKEAVRLALRRQKHSPLEQDLKVSKIDLANAIKTVRPSAIKAVTVEIPQVLWSDIGGMDDVKEKLRDAIEMPLAQRELFQKLKIPPPRGILLYGPPGTGKTMIARALATEGKMNFLAVKGPELLSKWLGESERALASLFRRARMASPSIIFLDEIDSIAAQRGSGDNVTGSRMLSQLLTELDGIVTANVWSKSEDESSNKNNTRRVIVMGATNRPDLLDKALTRPGRMDRRIYVGLPDRLSREKILEVALKGRKCDPNVNCLQLAQVSDGYSGAEVVAICREAALLALEEQCESSLDDNSVVPSPSIRMEHLLKAVSSTKKQITPEMLDFYASL